MQADSGGTTEFADSDVVPPSPRNLKYGSGGQLSVAGDVRPVLNADGFVEEERQLLAGVRVRAATVAKLVALGVDCFAESARRVSNGKRTDISADEADKEFPRVLFLMHPWFMASRNLAELFMDLYCGCDSRISCALAACTHTVTSSPNCAIQLYKIAVCCAVRLMTSYVACSWHKSYFLLYVESFVSSYFSPRRCCSYRDIQQWYWIRHFPMSFDLNAELSQAIHQLQEVIIQDDDEDSELAGMVDISKVPSYDWMRSVSVRHPTPAAVGAPAGTASMLCRHTSTAATRRVTLVFNNLQPAELAEQLTFLEYKAFRRITFQDFKSYATTASLKENSKLERSVALFNGLSQWIQCMVLSKTTPQQRAGVIVKFTDVAKRLRELNNFNTLMAVVGGLSHSCLARLSKTNSHIPHDTQKVLAEYIELLSSSNNFINYRRALHQAKNGFRIPILGVHLKDLVLLHTALPDWVDEVYVNFRKMVQLSIIFTELMQVQNSTLPIEPNMDLVNTVRLSLDLHYTEDEIYELSLAREPRHSLSSPSTPTKPVMFADWVAGVSPPDPQTINKHVHDMVEAVFKNYDHDKDGFISHGEFEAIAGNFPFIDSFAVLDADQDGMISKSEMKTYFIRANCHALRKCFKHDFHETTYFKPTFCIHCTGLLWGLIKQGWKCKDCGINAHRHCKDLVVMECRKHVSCHGRVPLMNGERNVTMASKRKMSQRQKTARSSQSTQTDVGSAASSRSSLLTDAASMTPPINDVAGSLSSPRGSSSEMPLSPVARPRGNTSSSSSLPSTATAGSPPLNGEFYEDAATLYDKLVKTEEVRDKLLRENEQLRGRVDLQSEQLSAMRAHIGVIRQHTITFILDQMETLHMQRDTEV